MGLTIKLYRCSDENERMDKSLTLLKSCSGQVKSDVSITNPVFILETTSINGLNYLFCEEYEIRVVNILMMVVMLFNVMKLFRHMNFLMH